MSVCYLHIGASKCASTSIQRSFQKSRDWLAEEGLIYPKSENARHDFLVTLHHANPLDLNLHKRFNLDRETVRQRAEAQRNAVEALIASQADRDVFLSTELLFDEAHNLDLVGLKRYLDGIFDRVIVVALVRDPLAWTNSRAQENVKSGGATLEVVVENPVLPRFEAIEAYRNTFGAEALRVRPMETLGTATRSLTQAFASWLFGHDRIADPLPDLSINESVPLEGLMIASEVNRFAGHALGHTKMASGGEGAMRGLSAQDFRKIGRTRFSLPAARVAQVLPRLQAQFDYLNATWGADYAPPDLSKWNDPVPVWDQDTLASIGVAMNDLGQAVQRLRAENLKLRENG
ncbi:MAG: hypothetical protein VX874_17315 [Pseudomonadota bacterium]|nr:hypothetical protein [Pseudomonadota bacterium]